MCPHAESSSNLQDERLSLLQYYDAKFERLKEIQMENKKLMGGTGIVYPCLERARKTETLRK